VAAIAIIVVEAASGSLLGVESELGIASAALDLTGGREEQAHHRGTETQRKQSGFLSLQSRDRTYRSDTQNSTAVQ